MNKRALAKIQSKASAYRASKSLNVEKNNHLVGFDVHDAARNFDPLLAFVDSTDVEFARAK